MKYYRTLQPFKVISFDLDDTLYDNKNVIRLTELNFLQDFKQRTGMLDLTLESWQDLKQRIAVENPLLAEDVTQWRFVAMQQLMQQQGKSAVEIEQISQASMAVFMQWRHKIDLPAQTISVLNQLKKYYKLAAITNGNVDPKRIGLDHFELVLRGGQDGRCKPHQALFLQTAEHFQVKPSEILHIGDDVTTDVQGAIQAGCQAVWLNLSEKKLAEFSQVRILPTVEISDLTQLLMIKEN